MKVAVLCLCLISIVTAWPVNKSKKHAISASSEEKYDLKGHHSHRHYHHHVNSQSWESLQHPQNDLASPQQTLYSSEESVTVPEQPVNVLNTKMTADYCKHFPDVSSKSHEDVDDDDDNDSNDTDESDEVVTGFPTDIPVTVPFHPFTRGDNAGRGDSVAHRVRAKPIVMKASKLRKPAKKLTVHDATEENNSALDADSQQGLSQEDSASDHSLGTHTISGEWADKSREQDSSELDSKLHDRSVENDSRQKFDSHKTEGDDDSKVGIRADSHHSMESREIQVRVSAEIPDDNSNQTVESAEDARGQHSIENNEVTL